MGKVLGKSLNTWIVNEDIEPRPACYCGMFCSSTGCVCADVDASNVKASMDQSLIYDTVGMAAYMHM